MFDFQHEFEKHLSTISFDQQPTTLFDPIRYSLSHGGKRLRPILLLSAYSLYRNDFEKALDAAAGIEIFHNFTLLHDDLMDQSDVRRGQPTVYRKWSPNVAILSGDAMLIESYKYISKVNSDCLPRVLSVFSQTALDVCKGQQYDMDFEEEKCVSCEDYLQMIRLKTAVLLSAALTIGAIIAEAPNEDIEHLSSFGEKIGIAFQLKDDLLDVYGDTQSFGKAIGKDIVNNKKTYLLITALEDAEGETKKMLLNYLNGTFSKDEKIEGVTRIYDELQIEKKTEDLINSYSEEALNHLDRLSSVNDEIKQSLYNLVKQLKIREK